LCVAGTFGSLSKWNKTAYKSVYAVTSKSAESEFFFPALNINMEYPPSTNPNADPVTLDREIEHQSGE